MEMEAKPAVQAAAVPGVSLSWEDVRYTVQTKVDKQPVTKTILGGVSGELLPGKLLAIMGPSGSGKTSMLNALAGRVPLSNPQDALSGSITVNGKRQANMHLCSAYVMQDDNLFGYSTVNETLMFAAALRLPSTMSLAQKQAHVDAVIGKLGLTPARDVIIGNAKVRGVSGGERKRVTIGVELLHDPPLVFLDEPTSGLDSFQAQSVMQTLRHLASAGHTVVCSIHQPRSSIYAMVDSLMLLAGGRCVYYGASGVPCHEYFATLGHAVPQDFNPADHLLDVISVDYRTKEQEAVTKERVDHIVRGWEQDGGARQALMLEEGAKALSVADVTTASTTPQEQTEAYAAAHGGGGAGFFTAFPLLLARTWRELTRNKFELALQIGMNLFFSALFGVIYLRMPRSQKSIMDRTGLLFFQAMNGAFGSAINTSTAIPTQLQVVQRERTAGMYGILPFYLATFVALIPLDTLPVLFNAAAIYWVANLRGGMDHFFIYAGLLCLEYFVGISLGMLISALIKNVEMAPRVAPAFVILFLMFSGFFLNDESVPVYMAWLKHISFIRYTFQGLCVNEFKGAEFAEGCSASRPVNGSAPYCATGDDVLTQLSFEKVELWFVVMMNFIVGCSFHVLAFLILRSREVKFLAFSDKKSA